MDQVQVWAGGADCADTPSCRSPRNPSDRNADPEWWPAGIDSPTRYFFLRARQLRYLRQHPPRDAKLQWRPFAEVTYRECRMLRRRGCPPLEVHVPMAMTGIEHSGQAAIKYLGSVVVSLQELHHPRAAAWASPVRLASPTEPSPTCTHAATAVPAYAGWNVQSPLFAAALAAAKRLAAAAAAASVGAGSHRESSGGSSSSATGGSSLWRMLHHTDIPTLSPTGSSGSLSIASSSTFTFSSSMRQLDPLKPSPTSPSNQQPAYCGQPPVMPACPNATHTPSSLLAVPACQAASLASPVLLATPPRSSQYHDQYRPEGQHQLPPQWLAWQPGRAYQPSQNKWGPAHEAATQHVAVL